MQEMKNQVLKRAFSTTSINKYSKMMSCNNATLLRNQFFNVSRFIKVLALKLLTIASNVIKIVQSQRFMY